MSWRAWLMTVDCPGILEALVPGRMQGHGGTAEVPQGPEVKAGAAVSTGSGGFSECRLRQRDSW
jgi:hypothetical protein